MTPANEWRPEERADALFPPKLRQFKETGCIFFDGRNVRPNRGALEASEAAAVASPSLLARYWQ